MDKDQLRNAAAYDIRCWILYHEMKCPNCHADITKMHPMMNLYPHWTGACVQNVTPIDKDKK